MLRHGNIISRLVLVFAALAGMNSASHLAALAQTSNETSASPDQMTLPAVSDGTKLDFYGDPLPQGALLRMGTVRLRHHGSVNYIVASPDGKSFATCGWDHEIRIWDAETGRQILQLLGDINRGSFAVAFSPDGKQLAATSDHGLVRIWDLASGREIWKSFTKGGRLLDIEFSPDGKNIATAGSDGIVRLWDVANSDELIAFDTKQRIRNHHAIAFSPDGKLLASGAGKDIQFFNLETGGEQAIKNAHRGCVISIAFTVDGKQIASAGESAYADGVDAQGEKVLNVWAETKLWHVESGKLVREFKSNRREPGQATIAISKAGTILAAVHRDKILLWDIANGELFRTISDYLNTTVFRSHGAAFSANGKRLAAVGDDLAVRIWDVETGKQIPSFQDSHSERVEDVASSPKAPIVASGSSDGSLRLWSLDTGKLLRVCEFPDLRKDENRGVHSVAFSPDGDRIAAGGFDWKDGSDMGVVNVWNVDDGSLAWSKRLKGRATRLKYSADGRRLVVAAGLGQDFPGEGQGCTLSICDAAGGKQINQSNGPETRAFALSVSGDGSSVTVVDNQKTVTNWQSDNKDQFKSFETKAHKNSLVSAAFSPDGKSLVTSGIDDILVFWDTATKSELQRVKIGKGKGSIVAISPDGKLLAAGPTGYLNTNDEKFDRSMHLWSFPAAKYLGRIELDQDSISSLTFTPDNQKLISGMQDGTLLVWDLNQLNPMPN